MVSTIGEEHAFIGVSARANGRDEAGEYVEIYNAIETVVDLEGRVLEDMGEDRWRIHEPGGAM